MAKKNKNSESVAAPAPEIATSVAPAPAKKNTVIVTYAKGVSVTDASKKKIAGFLATSEENVEILSVLEKKTTVVFVYQTTKFVIKAEL